MRKGQGALEYLIILSVIIVVALAVVINLPAITSLQLTTTTETRLNDIYNIIQDVSLKTAIKGNGNVQVSGMTFKYRSVNNFDLILTNENGINCTIKLGTVTGEWSSNSTDCPGFNGTIGELYSYRCVLKYSEPEFEVNYSKVGLCKGLYEEI